MRPDALSFSLVLVLQSMEALVVPANEEYDMGGSRTLYSLGGECFGSSVVEAIELLG
jgi:hypothetical protein